MPRPTVPAEPPKPITNSIGMKLVLIPAGEFLMGSPDSDKDARDDEKPQHRVRITRPFYLGATEVTQGQYRAVTGQSPSHFKGSDDLPVEQVSWNDAIAFCDKLSELEKGQLGGASYRLPTEAEWEYACRAGSTTRYSFGDDAARLGEFAWYDGNSGGKTHPVGQKRPNALNLYDMHGNVWEWCQDWYDKDYYGQSPGADPPGPAQAASRVDRGGSWFGNPQLARSAYRLGSDPGDRGNDLGFRAARVQSSRLVREPEPAPAPPTPAASAPKAAKVASDKPIRVLFIGNSLTFVNDLPAQIQGAGGCVLPARPAVTFRGGHPGRPHLGTTMGRRQGGTQDCRRRLGLRRPARAKPDPVHRPESDVSVRAALRSRNQEGRRQDRALHDVSAEEEVRRR